MVRVVRVVHCVVLWKWAHLPFLPRHEWTRNKGFLSIPRQKFLSSVRFLKMGLIWWCKEWTDMQWQLIRRQNDSNSDEGQIYTPVSSCNSCPGSWLETGLQLDALCYQVHPNVNLEHSPWASVYITLELCVFITLAQDDDFAQYTNLQLVAILFCKYQKIKPFHN